MSISAIYSGQTQVSVDQITHAAYVNFQGAFTASSTINLFVVYGFEWGIGAYTDGGPITSFGFGMPATGDDHLSGSFNYTPGTIQPGFVTQSALQADRTYLARTRVNQYQDSPFAFVGTAVSGGAAFKNNAVDATSDPPVASSVGTVTATISCLYNPNTVESTASVQLQYKRNVDPGWTNAGAPDVVTGYPQLSISRDISGLTPGTLYNVRLVITRTTNNSTVYTSGTVNFTTQAGDPVVTTTAASSIGPTSAQLNGTLNPNLNATNWYFEWGLTVAYGNVTPTQGPSSAGAPFGILDTISGLVQNTLYHFRAVAKVGAAIFNGADLNFTTTAPAGVNDHMPQIIPVFAKYGAAAAFDICVETSVAGGSDNFLSAAVPWVAGDVQVYRDGALLGNINALPTRVGATPVYNVTLTAAEMQGQQVSVLLRKLGSSFRDCLLIITTRLRLGQIDVDATAIGGNATAMSLVGVGTGYGLFAKGASGFRAEAQGAAGHGIIGVGVGSGQGMDAEAGATGRLNNFFDVKEGPEPFGKPADNETLGRIFQYLKRRETNRVTQTSAVQTWYRDDSVAVLAQRVVSDDLTTQTQQKLTN